MDGIPKSKPGSFLAGFVRPVVFLFLVSLTAGCSAVQSSLNPRSPQARDVANLSWLMFAIAGIVTLVVTGLLVAAIRRGRQALSDQVELNQQDSKTISLVLLGGALAPALVLIVVMSLSIAIENANAAIPKDALTVQVIGHQWWWEVRYPDQGVVTANEIHIPAGQPVVFKVTTADVIHSFWVPELHGKIDLIPGQTNTFTIQTDSPGTYRGQCAEFCGTQHAHMGFFVMADDPAQFQSWLEQQSQPAADPPSGSIEKEGQQAFLGSSCVYCHTIAGTNAYGTIGPDLTHLASRQSIGSALLPNNPGNLAGWVVNAQAVKPGNHMPPMDLSSDQIEAILAYLATLK